MLSRFGTDSSNAHVFPFSTNAQDIKSMGAGSPRAKGMGTGSSLCSMSMFDYSFMKETDTQGESTETTQLRSRSSLLCGGDQIQSKGDDSLLMQAQE